MPLKLLRDHHYLLFRLLPMCFTEMGFSHPILACIQLRACALLLPPCTPGMSAAGGRMGCGTAHCPSPRRARPGATAPNHPTAQGTPAKPAKARGSCRDAPPCVPTAPRVTSGSSGSPGAPPVPPSAPPVPQPLSPAIALTPGPLLLPTGHWGRKVWICLC